MLIEQTEEYKSAIASLTYLRGIHGSTPELKAIALLLIKVADVELTESVLRFVGNGSEQDQQVIEVFQDTLKAIARGDDDDELR